MHDWDLNAHFCEESDIGRFIRSQFVDTKPDKVDLKFLAIVYDSSGLLPAGQYLERLPLTCYISVATTFSQPVRKSQMDSWLKDLQPGLVWRPITGGLYGSEPFEEDRQSNGQRKLHTLLGEVPCNNKMRQQVNSCFFFETSLSHSDSEYGAGKV